MDPWSVLVDRLNREQLKEVQLFMGQHRFRIESEERRHAFEKEMELARKRFEIAEAERLLDVAYPFGRCVWVSSLILLLPSPN